MFIRPTFVPLLLSEMFPTKNVIVLIVGLSEIIFTSNNFTYTGLIIVFNLKKCWLFAGRSLIWKSKTIKSCQHLWWIDEKIRWSVIPERYNIKPFSEITPTPPKLSQKKLPCRQQKMLNCFNYSHKRRPNSAGKQATYWKPRQRFDWVRPEQPRRLPDAGSWTIRARDSARVEFHRFNWKPIESNGKLSTLFGFHVRTINATGSQRHLIDMITWSVQTNAKSEGHVNFTSYETSMSSFRVKLFFLSRFWY